MAAQFYSVGPDEARAIGDAVETLRDLTIKTLPPTVRGLDVELRDANTLAMMIDSCVTAMSMRPQGIVNESVSNGLAIAVGRLLGGELPEEVWPIALSVIAGNAMQTAQQIAGAMTPPTAAQN